MTVSGRGASADRSPSDHVATRILDAATGTGLAAIAAARATGPTGRVTGADISPGMLAQARHLITATGPANIDLIQADATSLARFPDASFDLIRLRPEVIYAFGRKPPSR